MRKLAANRALVWVDKASFHRLPAGPDLRPSGPARQLYYAPAYVRLPLHDQRDHSRSAGYSQLNPDDGIWCYLKGVERHGSVTA